MNIVKKIEEVNRPIIYISISIVLASICYGLNNIYGWLAILIAGLFFVFIKLKTNIIFLIVIVVFFIIEILLNYNYYNSLKSKEFEGNIRIAESKSYYTIAKYKGRKIYIDNIINTKIGERYYIEGIFKESKDVDRGIVGNITINNSKKLEADYINKLLNIRDIIYEKLKENLGQRKAGIVSSLSFGYNDYLDQEDETEMRDLGIIHVISVSGLHVTIIFAICSIFLDKRIALIVVTVYIFLTGLPPSAVRALIMIYILVMSKVVMKNYYSIVALAISAAITIVVQPYIIFNMGFILSYLSTIGIIIFSPKLQKKLYKLPSYIRDTISLTVSAQVLTTPVIILVFSNISITSLIGNLLVVPILNILIILGNLLILFIKCPGIFDFISFIILKVIRVFDYVMNIFYSISEGGYIINEKISLVYGLMIISMYFIVKGFRKFYLLPIIAIIITWINIFSPIPKVDYLEKGVMLISYRGSRAIVSNKNNVDMATLKEKNLAQVGYRMEENINIGDNIKILESKGNYTLKLSHKEYYIKLNNKGKINKDYDIINFIDKENKGFYIIGEKLILF